MKVSPIKTPLVKKDSNLLLLIKENIKSLPEKSVLVVTSKIVSLCQGRVLEKTSSGKNDKHELARREADFYLEPDLSRYKMMLTIKDNVLAVNAGIDESNADGKLILWPEKLQKTTDDLWRSLRDHYRVKKVGLIVTDSRSIPLKWGVIGTAVTHCGFKALYDCRGENDLFGREIKISQINVAEAVAVAAVLEMGEVAERTPLCLVEEITKIEFQDRPPTKKELDYLRISMKDDVYEPILSRAPWKKNYY